MSDYGSIYANALDLEIKHDFSSSLFLKADTIVKAVMISLILLLSILMGGDYRKI